MNLLQIIKVESSRPEDIIKIVELCNDIKLPRSSQLTVYHKNLSKEIRCHIQWTSEFFPENGEGRLDKVKSAFNEYGRVSSTLWLEVDKSNLTEQV